MAINFGGGFQVKPKKTVKKAPTVPLTTRIRNAGKAAAKKAATPKPAKKPVTPFKPAGNPLGIKFPKPAKKSTKPAPPPVRLMPLGGKSPLKPPVALKGPTKAARKAGPKKSIPKNPLKGNPWVKINKPTPVAPGVRGQRPGPPMSQNPSAPLRPSAAAPGGRVPPPPVPNSQGGTPGAPQRPAPVGGGSGATGGSGGAAGAAAGAGTGNKKPDTIDTLFKPLTDAMSAEQARNAELAKKMAASREAYNNWVSTMMTQGQTNYQNNMADVRKQTSDNIAAISSRIGQYARGTDPRAAAASGMAVADAMQDVRGGQIASDTQMAANADAAIQARLADQTKFAGALSYARENTDQALLARRDDDFNKRNSELQFNIGKARLEDLASQRQAMIDAQTAAALAGDRAIGRQLDFARLGLDQQRAAQDAEVSRSQIALNRARALDLKFKNKGGMTYAQLYDRVAGLRGKSLAYKNPQSTPEDKYRDIGNILRVVRNLIKDAGLPPNYAALVMGDVFGPSNVKAALVQANKK